METMIKNGVTYKKVIVRSIKKNGKTIHHPRGGVFAFWVEVK